MKRSLPFILCICFGIAFIYIAATIGNGAIVNFDTVIISFVQGFEAPLLTAILKGFTWIGSGAIVALIAIIVLILLFFIYRQRRAATLFAITIAGTGLLNLLLKLYFQRERPEIHRIMDAKGFSFPSGHAMAAFSLYTILAYLLWHKLKTRASRLLLTLFTAFMILIIAMSRIYLGVHYPSDIIGGFMASALWVTLIIAVSNLLRRDTTAGANTKN